MSGAARVWAVSPATGFASLGAGAAAAGLGGGGAGAFPAPGPDWSDWNHLIRAWVFSTSLIV